MTRWLTVLGLLLLAVPAFAADQGKVASLKGDLQINGKKAGQGSAVHEGDTLLTGEKTTADVVMESGVRFRLYDRSKLVIPAESRKNPFQLIAGRLLSIVRKGRAYSVSGQTAVAGVRGTTFFVQSEEGKRTYICACKGKLHLETPGGVEKGELVGEHHTALSFDDKDTTEEPMIGHTDDDIAALEALK
jgi:ferric-dicitrate binding protein FerR (iron transport regulator)